MNFQFVSISLQVDCLQRSRKCRKLARLAELQIRLLPNGKRIIGLEKHNVNTILVNHADFHEVFVNKFKQLVQL